MILVDDSTSIKCVCFLTKKIDSKAALRSSIADFATPADLAIRILRTGEEREFQGQFRELLNELANSREYLPPDTPEKNSFAEKELELLEEKIVVVLKGLKKGRGKRPWG